MLLEAVQPESGVNADENQDQLRRPTAQSRPKIYAASCFSHEGNDLCARQFGKREERREAEETEASRIWAGVK